MTNARLFLVPVALTLIGGAALFARTALNPGAPSARLVSASIAVDGEVVLRASTSDDGHPDADEVWSYLVERLEFQPTEAFASLGIDAATGAVTLGRLKSREDEHLGEPPKLALEVAYGGTDAPFLLGLVRSPGKATWRVDPETVERRFSHRRITRAQAAELADPKRRK